MISKRSDSTRSNALGRQTRQKNARSKEREILVVWTHLPEAR